MGYINKSQKVIKRFYDFFWGLINKNNFAHTNVISDISFLKYGSIGRGVDPNKWFCCCNGNIIDGFESWEAAFTYLLSEMDRVISSYSLQKEKNNTEIKEIKSHLKKINELTDLISNISDIDSV